MNELVVLNVLHIINDGCKAAFTLLLPFIAKDLHLSLSQVGLLGTALNMMEVLLAIPAGFVATRYGGIKVLSIALLLDAIGYIGTGFSLSFLLLGIMFMLGGIGYAVFHPISFALVARKSSAKGRGKAMGDFTAFGDLGKIGIQAAVTFIVVLIGWRITAIGTGLLIFIIFALTYRYLLKKDTLQKTAGKTNQGKILTIFTNKHFLLASAALFFDAFASSSLYIFLPFLFLKRGISPALLGSFTATFFVGNLFGKVVLGRLVDSFGNKVVFILSEIAMACFIFLLASTTNIPLLIGISIILGAFTKGTVPILQTFVTDAVHEEHFEKAFGIAGLFAPVGTALSPLFLGILSDKVSIFFAFEAMSLFALAATIPIFFFHKMAK